MFLSFALSAEAEGTVDSFLKKGQERQRTDTNYVFKPQEKWLLRTRSDVIFSLLDFRNDHPSSGVDFSMNLNSKPQFRQHFGVGYRGIVLGFGISIPLKNSDKEFSLKVYQDPAGGEITYGVVKSLKGQMNVGDQTFDMAPGALGTKYLRIGAYYAFNWKKCSMPAAMTQSRIQRRSAGTPLIVTKFRMLWNDFSYEQGDRYDPVFKTRSIVWGIGAGYCYNWVPSEHWLIHISATETFGLVGNTRITLRDSGYRLKERFIPLITSANLGFFYYYKHFYVGAFGLADNLFIPSKERRSKDNVNISLSRFSAHFTIGLRL